MLVESLEGADEDAAILQDAAHPVVDVLQHLAALAHSHDGGFDGADSRRILFSAAYSPVAARFPPPRPEVCPPVKEGRVKSTSGGVAGS